MPSTTRTIARLAFAGILVAACGSAGAPTAAPPSPAPPTVAPVVPTPTVVPTATPLPTTDGQGAEHFTGVFTSNPVLTTQYTLTQVGEVLQYRGGVAEWTFTSNDRRMGGDLKWQFSIDAYGTTGPQWGPVTITQGSGTWSGTCTAGAWESSDRLVAGCWLTGSREYKGLSAYLHFSRISAATATVEGIIFPGPVPKF